MLAFFAQMTAQKEGWQTMLYQPPTEAEEVLEALVNRRNRLVEMRTAEKNRLHQVYETQVESIKQLRNPYRQILGSHTGKAGRKLPCFSPLVANRGLGVAVNFSGSLFGLFVPLPQKIRMPLHHFLALRQVFRAVVGGAHFVLLHMGYPTYCQTVLVL